jgi:hypothetical protein
VTPDSAEALKRLWVRIFRRRGGNGICTRAFDDLDVVQQRVLRARCAIGSAEVPVIGGAVSATNWFVLITTRLVCAIDGIIVELRTSDISHAHIDLQMLRSRRIGKLDATQLQVFTTDGHQIEIEVEAGKPLFGVWNILLNIGARNRRSARRAAATRE